MSFRTFALNKIEASLEDFQSAFPAVNARLALHREPFDNGMRAHIIEAYVFLNGLLRENIDLFSSAGLHSLLELNHIVLCGNDHQVRFEYHKHILQTREVYQKRIKSVRKWVESARAGNPFRLATGFYVRAVSRPQLFVEGNHRTGNIVLNYLLVSRDLPPFVITPETAFDYLQLSGGIKLSDMGSLRGHLALRSHHHHRFAAFLQQHLEPDYLET